MTDQEIFELIRPHIAEKLGAKLRDVTMETDLSQDLGADSLDRVEMGMKFKADFGIKDSDVGGDDGANNKIVADYVALI